MRSFLRRATWPVAVAGAMVAMLGVFGTTATAVHATPGDVCGMQVIGPDGVMVSGWENNLANSTKVFNLETGKTYGLVFRIENDGNVLLDGADKAQVLIDSETGSGKITSQMEIDGQASEDPLANPDVGDFPNGRDWNIGDHNIAATNTATVDVIEPYDFNDADGHSLDSISDFLKSNGFNPASVNNHKSVCDNGDFIGNDDESTSNCKITASGPVGDQTFTNVTTDCGNVDGWGFVNFQCNEPGSFYLDVIGPSGDTSASNNWAKFVCPGVPDTATISVLYTTLETNPATAGVAINHGETPVTVTVKDQNGNPIDGAHVTLTTDDCTFQPSSTSDVFSPAGGGKTVDIVSDTDAAGPDQNFLTNNPLQTQAGTAEATLDCDGPLNVYGPGGTGHVSGAAGTPGTAHISAIVNRPGADIVLSATVNVVGPTSANGLTLTLSATSVQCGNPITATVKAVDANGVAVSDGTQIFFTTDTSSGVVGGLPAGGAQGAVTTVGGAASANIATDPSKPGTHTVIAYVMNGAGGVAIQQTATYNCTVPAPAAPTVPAPATGTGSGTGSITPPNTGDAGLAATNTGSSSLFVIAGAIAMALAGFATFKFSRNS